jgi:zinc-ribbon domain
MYIRCPNCGRRGFLPDRLVPEANSLRCRKCRAQFFTPELAGKAAERGAGTPFDGNGNGGGPSREKPASYLADGFYGGFDASDSPRDLGPGDSNYELTFTLRDTRGDSNVDWETATEVDESEAPSSDEIEAVEMAIDRSSASETWHHRFLVAWGPLWIGGVMALIAVTIPIVGFLLWRTFAGGADVSIPSPILVAGLACTVALLVISVPLVLLAAGLTELVRDVRGLRDHLERKS